MTTVTLAPGESKEILFEATPFKVKTYRVVVDGLEGSFNAVAPPGVVLNYKNPKRSSTHWHVLVFDIANRRWTAPYMPEPIGSLRSFPDLSPGNFLLVFKESYDVFFNDYQYGPLLVAIPELGTYTWDAGAETLSGHRAINLPKSNNLCQIIGTVTAREEIDEYTTDITIDLEEAKDVSGYVNAGQFFVGSSIKVRTTENTYRLVGEKITARLKMVSVPLGEGGEYGYTYGWDISDISFATGFPPWMFNFSGEVTRYTFEIIDINTGYPRTVEGRTWIVRSNVGLTNWAVGVTLTDPEFGDVFMMYRGTGTYLYGASIFQVPGHTNPGIPADYTVEVYAHPDPNESFDRWDYASQRGWLLVAVG